MILFHQTFQQFEVRVSVRAAEVDLWLSDREAAVAVASLKPQPVVVVPAEDVERHQPQPGELDDQHDDHEAAGHPGPHPRVPGARPELRRPHAGALNAPSCCPTARAGRVSEDAASEQLLSITCRSSSGGAVGCERRRGAGTSRNGKSPLDLRDFRCFQVLLHVPVLLLQRSGTPCPLLRPPRRRRPCPCPTTAPRRHGRRGRCQETWEPRAELRRWVETWQQQELREAGRSRGSLRAGRLPSPR